MRLLSLDLIGKYKGLRDQLFDFKQSEGNIIAFIGLNGSGKSQLLELIAESFAYLERYQREDFRTRSWFDFAINIKYSNQEFDSGNKSICYQVSIDSKGKVSWQAKAELLNDDLPKKLPLPSHIVGYSSGLNENLQRAFMKSYVQYMDTMNAKRSWETRLTKIKKIWDEKGKTLTESDLVLYDKQVEEAYSYYQKRHSGIFPEQNNDFRITEDPELGIRATPLSIMKYLDHDTTGLLLTSLGMLSIDNQKKIFNQEQRFNHVRSATFKYDLRKFTYDAGALLDIAKLVTCVGGKDSVYYKALSNNTSDELYNQFELDHLAGEITLDFNDTAVQETIRNAFFEPEILFEKLFRIQLLGAEFWPGEMKRQLRQDDFDSNVKKPQKWRAPLQVISLQLADEEESTVAFEDLSDGEAQLIQILAMAAVFKESRTLFLLDEPETHLNPSWRTYFHSYLDEALNNVEQNQLVQLFVSTHSPFMISSLKRQNVYFFKRDSNGLITMQAAPNQTYGSSFDMLIKEYFNIRSLISQNVVEEIRKQLKQDDAVALAWINENLGLSPEKAYLQRKLSKNVISS
jgi:predicted ATPase